MYITDSIRQLAHTHDRAKGRQGLSKGEEQHLVSITPFIKDGAFGPDVISVMATAFEDLCKTIEVSGRSDITKETIAAKIIELARGGEADPVVLRGMALSQFGLSRLSNEPDGERNPGK
jgi:hypothetical protein